MYKIKEIFYKSFLLVIGLFISFVILEIISGIYVKKAKIDEKRQYIEDKLQNYHQPNVGCEDNVLGWGFSPNTQGRVVTSDFNVVYSINSKGIRDKEIPFEKPIGEFRIVVLGESNVFGEGLNYGERLTDIIEQALDKVEVINMAVWGFGMDQSFLQLQRDGFKFNPDLVILFIPISDFVERCKFYSMVDRFKPRFILNEAKDTLVLQELSFFKSKFNTKAVSRPIRQESDNKAFWDKNNLFAIFDYYNKRKAVEQKLEDRDKRWWDSLNKACFTGRKDQECEYKEADFRKIIFLLLKEYKKICDTHKVYFLVVDMDSHNLNYIGSCCQNLNIPYLDLSDVLAQASKFKPLRFAIDPHYNEFTHKVIGEYLSGYLNDKYNLKRNKDYIHQFLGKF